MEHLPITGKKDGLDFDGLFAVADYPGVAFYLWGQATVDGVNPRKGFVVAGMVGDDRRHLMRTTELTQLKEQEYCPSCGQIGCCHGKS